MRTGTPRDEGHESIVEIQGNSPVVAQRFIGSKTERIHGMDDTMTLTKFGKNRAERRKTNPTSTDSLEMVLLKVRLDILTNKRQKMRRDLN
jgi:CMP-2-keto-3-deoxyoctulosonic acid synthetase